MWGRLRALSSIGHEVDVLIAVWAPLNQEIVAAIEKHARNILVCLRQPMWKGLIGSQPCQVASRQELQSVPLRSKYDAALLEGDAVGAVLDIPRCGATFECFAPTTMRSFTIRNEDALPAPLRR